MTKEELEVKIESLKTMITEGQQQTSNYAGQLDTLNKQLKDLGKIALPPVVFDDIYEAAEKGVSEFDWSDTDNFDKEFSIDYDNRVCLDNFDLTNSTDLVEMIVEKVSRLFKEADAPEDTPEKVKYDDELNK